MVDDSRPSVRFVALPVPVRPAAPDGELTRAGRATGIAGRDGAGLEWVSERLGWDNR